MENPEKYTRLESLRIRLTEDFIIVNIVYWYLFYGVSTIF